VSLFVSSGSEPTPEKRWWKKHHIPWFAWPFVAVAVAASAVLVAVAWVASSITDPLAGWSRIAAVGLVATIALPFTGNWGWAVAALVLTVAAGALEIRHHRRREQAERQLPVK
jgi:uncharacterized membrane protein YadS